MGGKTRKGISAKKVTKWGEPSAKNRENSKLVLTFVKMKSTIRFELLQYFEENEVVKTALLCLELYKIIDCNTFPREEPSYHFHHIINSIMLE